MLQQAFETFFCGKKLLHSITETKYYECGTQNLQFHTQIFND